MQIRCDHCHKPFAIGKQEAHTALDILNTQKLSHYDVQCPHCRRINRVSQQELEHSTPDWKPATSGDVRDS
jgi:phage FluMu protein Com